MSSKSNPTIQREARANRKGLMMGLTLAEVLILVLFALLLLLVNEFTSNSDLEAIIAISEEDPEFIQKMNEYKDLIQVLSSVETDPQNLAESVKEILESNQEPFDDTFDELVSIEETLIQREEELEQLIVESEKLQSISEKLSKTGSEDQAILAALDEAIKEKNQSELRERELAAAIKDLRKRKGAGFPSCWYDESEKPDYLWSVAMYDDELVFLDRYLPNRVAEKIEMGLDKAPFGQKMNRTEFSMWGKLARNWAQSREPECRFFVLVYDLAGDDKENYKTLLHNTVGYYFIPHLKNRPTENDFYLSGRQVSNSGD